MQLTELVTGFNILVYLFAAFFGYGLGTLQNPRIRRSKRLLSDSAEGALVSKIIKTMKESPDDWRQNGGTFMYLPNGDTSLNEIVFRIHDDRRSRVRITIPITTELSRGNENWVIEAAEEWQRWLVLRKYELKGQQGQLI